MAGRPNTKMFKTMVAKHGSEEKAREWFRTIGASGGKASGTGGFFARRDIARIAGAKGGMKSRRGKST